MRHAIMRSCEHARRAPSADPAARAVATEVAVTVEAMATEVVTAAVATAAAAMGPVATAPVATFLMWAKPLSFRSQADFYETDGQKRMQLLSGPQNLTIC